MPLGGARAAGRSQPSNQLLLRGQASAAQPLTFDAGHLLALCLAEKVQLVGDGLQHLDKVGEEEDDMDVVVGEVPAAADALGPLHMGATEQSHCGPLVHVLGVQSETKPKKKGL